MGAMATILDFQPEQFYLFLIYKLPQFFKVSFKPIGHLIGEETIKYIFKMAATVTILDFWSERF